MLIAGVDLAAEPKGTALAILECTDRQVSLVDLRTNISDDEIVTTALRVEKLGIDCALGWPTDFVEFLIEHNREGVSSRAFVGDAKMRRNLAFRETDRQVRKQTGRWPLSVSTDRLGMTAIRCAGVLTQIGQSGVPIDRTGEGKLVEIYPGASLRYWGFNTAGYRTSESVRRDLLGAMADECPALNLNEFSHLMVSSCDAFDAVVAALSALAAIRKAYVKPSKEQHARARVEGWIALPNVGLGELVAAKL